MPARKHEESAAKYVLRVLRQYAERELSMDDLYLHQGDAPAHDRNRLHTAIGRLTEQGSVVRVTDHVEKKSYWSITAISGTADVDDGE